MTMETAQDRALLHLGQALRERGYHFITPTPLTHERVNQRPQNALAGDLPGVFGWSRPFQHELLPPPLFSLMDQAQVLEPCGPRWRSRVRLSSLDGQLFVHSAYPTDSADAVFFGPDTYRFASAIRCHLDRHTGEIRRVVDIGCGSGAGAILTALARPQAEVLAVDIKPRGAAPDAHQRGAGRRRQPARRAQRPAQRRRRRVRSDPGQSALSGRSQ